MKITGKIFVQCVLLSLATQTVWGLVSEPNNKKDNPSLGSMYRSAALRATNEKDVGLNYPAGQQPGYRGVRCYGCRSQTGLWNGGGYGDDRYYDDYYYRRSYSPYSDRNWYYQPESRYDDRSRYGGYNRYDDRYYNNYNYNSPYDYRYDPYDNYYLNNARGYYEPNSYYRGNGYDNTNPKLYEMMRQRFYDRNYGGYDRTYGYEDRYPSYRNYGYYDYKNYRPFDQTYRGTAGFDQSGRGYYWAAELDRCNGPCDRRPPYDRSPPHDRSPPYDRPPYDNQDSQYAHSQHHRPQSPQNSRPQYNSQDRYPLHHTTPIVPPEFYQGKPASSGGSAPHTQKVSSNTIGVDGGGGYGDRWSHNNDNSSSNNNNNSNKSDSNNSKDINDKDKESPAYGNRPQSLGTMYLHDRNTNEASGDATKVESAGVENTDSSTGVMKNKDAK